MSNPLILCPHVPGHRAVETIPATLAIMRIERTYPVQWVECHHPTDYAAAVIGFWGQPGDLLIIEQDMEPTLDMIEDLLTCPCPACTQVYYLAPASTGLTYNIPSVWGEHNTRLNVGDRQGWYSAIGLCKLSGALRQRVPPPNLVQWRDVEGEINRLVNHFWHVHWPAVAHHHGFNRERKDHVRSTYDRSTADLSELTAAGTD